MLIDDGLGAETATREIRRLERRRSTGSTVGSIRLASTLTVLEKAAGTTHITDRAQMREIYQRLRDLDDGLPPIEKTALLVTARWKGGATRCCVVKKGRPGRPFFVVAGCVRRRSTGR
ncbi:hypothetical protein [Actinoplanes sp. NPDC026623]|uniref:hypothetical protein n=1 Tax=Actinoplanes sp. NPDC026623 TaxID=3155610 RepID=UPI0033C354E8